MAIQNLLKKSSQELKKTSTTPLLDCEIFLCEAIQKEKEFILANLDYKISKNQEKKFWGMVERRKKHEPVAYIINRKEFFGLDFFVNHVQKNIFHRASKNVLIPRPETEMLVEETISIIQNLVWTENSPPIQKNPLTPFLKGGHKNINIIDVGTGSGCIIAAIANYFCNVETQDFASLQIGKNIKIFAIDNSSDSLKIAKRNFRKLGIEKQIKILKGNLIEPYLEYCNCRSTMHRAPTHHVIIANLPYLNEQEYKNCPSDVKKYEPKNALYGGKDGLKFIKKLISQIEKSGLENYSLLLEMSPTQAEFLKSQGFKIKKDLFKIERYALKVSLPS